MADLIDSSTHAWKPNLVKAIYPSPISNEILSLPISTIGADADRQVWKHSSSGDYQVKKAYNLLSRNTEVSTQTWWHVIWKVQVPLKICNMVWRLYMTTCLPSIHLEIGGFLCQAHALSVMKLKKLHHIFSCFVPSLELFGMAPHWQCTLLTSGIVLCRFGLISFCRFIKNLNQRT